MKKKQLNTGIMHYADDSDKMQVISESPWLDLGHSQEHADEI